MLIFHEKLKYCYTGAGGASRKNEIQGVWAGPNFFSCLPHTHLNGIALSITCGKTHML